jgi:hypothetical protein
MPSPCRRQQVLPLGRTSRAQAVSASMRVSCAMLAWLSRPSKGGRVTATTVTSRPAVSASWTAISSRCSKWRRAALSASARSAMNCCNWFSRVIPALMSWPQVTR